MRCARDWQDGLGTRLGRTSTGINKVEMTTFSTTVPFLCQQTRDVVFAEEVLRGRIPKVE